MARLRLAIVGARRERQGIGEFVAREFLAAGTELCAVVGTRDETVADALSKLRGPGAEETQGFTSLSAAIETARPDVVAICSPFRHHLEALDIVANSGCHCLCEKPLWWDPSLDVGRETERLVDAFAQRRRHLALVTQWPETLGDFYRLYPEARDEPLRNFEMHLAPRRGGAAMALDAAPHPISMLQTLLGRGDIENVEAKYSRADGDALCLTFSYRHSAGVTTARCHFTVCEEPPRPASYSLNGRWVHRTVELPEYQLYLTRPGSPRSDRSGVQSESEEKATEEKRVPIEDPLKSLVVGFVRQLERAGQSRENLSGEESCGTDVQRQLLIESMLGLQALVKAAEAAEERQVVDSN